MREIPYRFPCKTVQGSLRKKCRRCGHFRYFGHRCGFCARQYARSYYKEHSDKIRKRAVFWEERNKEKVDQYRKTCRNKPQTKVRQRLWHIQKWYGLSKEDYYKILRQQEYCCPICSKKLDADRNIDHDHRTGTIRGIVHRQCNILLGYIEENINLIPIVLAYLRR